MEGKVELRFILCKSCIINVNYSNRRVQQDFGKKSDLNFGVGVQQKIVFFLFPMVFLPVSNGSESYSRKCFCLSPVLLVAPIKVASSSQRCCQRWENLLSWRLVLFFCFGFFPKQHRLPKFFWTQNDELLLALIWEVFEWNC